MADVPTLPFPRFALRLVAEFVVIVMGILSAIAVDGWTQSRAEEAQEAAYLDALVDDFQANREVVRSVRGLHTDAEQRGEWLLAQLEGERASPPPWDSLASAVELLGWNTTRPFVWDTWDDLISTGNSDVISSRELRVELQSFFRVLELAGIFEDETFGYRQDYRIAVRDVLPPGVRLAVGERLFQHDPGLPIPDGSATAALDRLRAVPSVRGILTEVVMSSRGATYTYAGIEDGIEAMIARLEGELALLR